MDSRYRYFRCFTKSPEEAVVRAKKRQVRPLRCVGPAAVALALLLVTTLPSLCAAAEGAYPLDEIIVTATRIEEPIRQAPANITIITGEEIAASGATTVSEIFDDEPGLVPQHQIGGPKFSSLDIRGFGEAAPRNVLFLVDGRRVNNVDINGADLTQIPLEAIERVEVYRGIASVMFGDNAYAGAVNIILKEGEGPPRFTAGLMSGSYNLLNPSLSVSGKSGPFSYFLLSSSYDTDGYRHNNSLHMKDFFGNLAFKPTDRFKVTLKSGYHNDRYGMPGPLLSQEITAGTYDRKDSKEPFNDGSTEDTFVDLTAEASLAAGVNLTFGGSYRNRHPASWFQGWYFGSPWHTQSKGQAETYTFTPKLVVNRPVFSLKSVFVAGFDYFHYPTAVDWAGAFFGFPSRTTADLTRTDYGLYGNEKLHLREDLFIEAGYRRQKAVYRSIFTDYLTPSLSGTSRDTVTGDALRASANYTFAPQGNVFLTCATGFRFPTTDEMVNVQTGTVNRTLKPQKGWEVDLGIRWNPLTWLGGTLTLFQSRTKDEIYYDPLTFANSNYDRTLRRGLEALVMASLRKDLKFSLGYSYVKPVFDGGAFDGNDIPFVPRHKLTSRLAYVWWNLTLNLGMAAYSDRYAISDQDNNNRKEAGYVLFDTSALYRSGNLLVQAGVKNLTGTRYNDYAVASAFSNRVNLYPAAERTYFMKVEYGFGG